MSYTQTQIIPGSLLTNAAAIYYTCPANIVGTKISTLTVFNSDTVARTATIYLASSSSAPSAVDEIAVVQLQSLQSVVIYQAINALLIPGNTIQAKADTGSVVSIKATGVVITV